MRTLDLSLRLGEELFRLRGQLVTGHWQSLRTPPAPTLAAATRLSTQNGSAPSYRTPEAVAEGPRPAPSETVSPRSPSVTHAELPADAELPLPEQPLKLEEAQGAEAGGQPRTPRAASDERGVPAHPVTRAMHFGGLGIGLATGAAAAAVRRAVTGETDMPLVMSEANVERLASTLCRLRGAALKVGQMLSFNDAAVLPPAMRALMDRVRDGADWMPSWQLKKTLDQAKLPSLHQSAVSAMAGEGRDFRSPSPQELGDDWRQHVVSFEETPVAAASIGQVHRAVLTDGRAVAIKVQYPGVADSIQSDLWSMKQLINYTGVVPPGLYLDKAHALLFLSLCPFASAPLLLTPPSSLPALSFSFLRPSRANGDQVSPELVGSLATASGPQVLKVANEELMQECDYELEAENTKRFKLLLAPYPEFSVPAVVPHLSSARVLTTEWMPGLPLDRAAASPTMTARERDRVGTRLLWLTLTELFSFRFMQTDPNWSNFLYEPRTGQLSLIDFGACRQYDESFAENYLQLMRACAEGDAQREQILHYSRELAFLTGDESKTMLDAHVRAAVLVGTPFAEKRQPYDFASQQIARQIASDVSTMLKHRLTPPREEIYTLHRRLNGCFQLAARVGARIPARSLLLEYDQNHVCGKTQAEQPAVTS